MESPILTRLLAALALGAIAAIGSRRFRFLTKGGAASAGLLAALLYGLGSWQWLLPMLLFFVSSSLLSRICEGLVPGVTEVFEKGSERDALQVLANGGIGMLLVLCAARWEGNALYASYLASLAAAAADTWGTELGMLSRSRPRLITSLAAVEPGTSGAVSGTGLVGACAGASLIALFGGIWIGPGAARILPAVALAGLAGAMLDSLLGASLQGQYRCGACGTRTERRTHCGVETRQDHGVRWITNDGVNIASNAAGAVFGYIVALALV